LIGDKCVTQNGTVLKILIVHNSLNDGASMSGVLKHYLLMARAWADAGHQVDFLVAKAGFPQIQSQAPFCGFVCSDTFFDASAYLDQTWRYFPAFGFRMLSAHWVSSARDYDIVYASNFLIFEVYPALVMARRCGAKLVVKIQHLLHSQSGRHTFFDRLFLTSEKWSMRLACRHADLIMCLSQPVKTDFCKLATQLNLKWSGPEVVGCGLDFTELDNTPTENTEFDLVLLGRIHEQKGVFDLPDVWGLIIQKRPESRMVVIGEGPHRKMLMKTMEERGLAHSITFTGGIPEEEKNKFLRQSKLGLSLSFEEGWGLSVTEFLAAGLPVVAYDLPVFRELFSEVLHFIPLKSKSLAAEAILSLLDHPEDLKSSGLKGMHHARQFNYQEVANQELSLMKKLIQSQ
jgi:glycosyltransferase involved in cell wall biosynthesis